METMIIKMENVIGHVDIKSNEHICFECLKDTDMKNLTVLMKNQLKKDESCICDKCKRIIW